MARWLWRLIPHKHTPEGTDAIAAGATAQQYAGVFWA